MNNFSTASPFAVERIEDGGRGTICYGLRGCSVPKNYVANDPAILCARKRLDPLGKTGLRDLVIVRF
jgi:hypothetical protein